MILRRSLDSIINITICIIIFSFSNVPTGFGANILIVCPFFSRSAYEFHASIARSLHTVGHKITIVSPFSKDAVIENFTVIDSSHSDEHKSNFLHIHEAEEKSNLFSILPWVRQMSEEDCYNTIQLDKIQKIMQSKEKQFDVMILFLTRTLYECFSPIAEILEIPIIGTGSTILRWGIDRLIGNPHNPAAISSELLHWPLKMSFTQRLTNSWYWIVDYLFENFSNHPTLEVIYKKHFPSSSVALRKKVSIMFTNSHQVLVPRQRVPNVINIGGIHKQSQPIKPLPQSLEKFIDEAKHGVILFTLGSILKMFDEKSTEFGIFKTAFAAIPQRVVWKMENKAENLPENVMTSNWLPQRDILAHRNVVAFITHCGLSGIFEAIFEAKPLIMMPVISDQRSNSAILKDLGVGASLDVKTLTVEKVLTAINNIIQDTKYRTQMQNISKIVKDAPMTPEETVVYWTEYVIRHKGAPHLRTVAADMPLDEYLLLDVILFMAGVTLIFVYLSFWCCKKSFRQKI